MPDQPAQRSPQAAGPAVSPVLAIAVAAYYLLFAVVAGSLSQLALAPVYGAIPSYAQHLSIMRWAILLAFLGKGAIKDYLPPRPPRYLPFLAFYLPLVQWFIFQDSARLGATNGPLTSETVSYFPIILIACICASDALDAIPLYQRVPAVQVVVGVLALGGIYYGEPYMTTFLGELPARTDLSQMLTQLGSPFDITSRVNLQMITAASAIPLSPSWINVLAIPALVHTTLFNSHLKSTYTNHVLNGSLYNENWMILDRQESTT